MNVFETWKEYGFEILFFISVFILVIILIINNFNGTKGTYQNHTPLIKTLLSKSTYKLPLPKQSFESKGEKECRKVAQDFFNLSFPKMRPFFLRNEITGGNNLELDCYNDELKLAIEYNGEQHYKFIPHFHKNKEAFYNTKYRDELKNRLCEKHGVKLIIVPFTEKNIRQYLHQNFSLAKNGKYFTSLLANDS